MSMINMNVAAMAALTFGFSPAIYGSDNEGAVRGCNEEVAVLSPVEIDAFEARVRDHYDRPQESIPVSEGGTTFGGGTSTEQASPVSAFLSSAGVVCGGHRYVASGLFVFQLTNRSQIANRQFESESTLRSAPDCSQCPQGNGAAWCNGDCTWNYDAGQCELPPLQRCDDAGAILRQRCAECTAAQCTGTLDCERMSTTDFCRYVLEEETRSASVHLHYEMPASVPEPAWWFQRLEIVSSTDVSYFNTAGHSFGYAGFQQSTESPFQGRILFSIWDQGGCDQDVDPNCPAEQVARTVACGSGIKCEDFGGEGTGRKSIVYSDDLPVVGQPYYMVTHAQKVGPFRMQYSAYFYVPGAAAWGSAPLDGTAYAATPPGWRFLSRIEVGTDAQERWRMANMHSFVEQWFPVRGLARRAALFGPGFVAQDPGAVTASSFAQIGGGFFGYGTLENHKHVNAFQSGDQMGIGLEIGGGVVREAVRYQHFNYPEATPPSELVCFAEKSGCLSEATTTADIEACLEGNNSCEKESPGDSEDPSDCTDTVGWTDLWGYGCSWYDSNEASGCPIYGQFGAKDNCCFCQNSMSLTEPKKE